MRLWRSWPRRSAPAGWRNRRPRASRTRCAASWPSAANSTSTSWPICLWTKPTRWLTSFDGIGHKTASIVLLFCFNKPAFPVDTHVGRVTRRLGLAGPKDSEEKIKAIWESLAPAAWFYPLHLNLIRHGREVCHAQRPECAACALEDICKYPQKP